MSTISKEGYWRGQYYKRPSWTMDTETKYYQGFTNKWLWPGIKYVIVISLYQFLRKYRDLDHSYCLFSVFLLTAFYQDIIALFLGYNAIPAMDAGCFISSSRANVNVSNCTILEKKVTREQFIHNITKVVKQ